MTTDCIDHEKATIRSYMRDPEFAEYMLQEAIADRDSEAITRIQRRINEAKARTQEAHYWDSLLGHAQKAAQNGYNV